MTVNLDTPLPGPAELATLSLAQLHQLVYARLLPALEARDGRAAAERRLLRFKVLGGLGPAATADFLKELIAATPAANDRQHLRLDVKIDPTMGTGGGSDEATLPVTQEALDLLLADTPERTAFCLPCNTAHWRIDRLDFDRNRVTFVSMIDAAVEAVRAVRPTGGTVALLATARMVASGLYQAAFSRAGFAVVTPGVELQARLTAAIYGGEVDGRHHAGVKGGDTGPAATALVQSVVDALCAAQQINAICLSCTELPLVFGPQLGGAVKGDAGAVPVVNATRALAHSFARHCLRIQAQELLKP